MSRHLGQNSAWYTIWDGATDQLLCCGTRQECARMLGLTDSSFMSAVSRCKTGARRKYSILVESLSQEEMEALQTKRPTILCPYSGIPTDVPGCAVRHPACASCGWHPVVHACRVRQIRRLAAEGRLREWGKEKS